MSKPRDWSRLYIVVLAALPLLFHWRILTPNALDRGSFPTGDFAEQFYAFARFAYDELAQGRLPLWNPYTYAGHPFLADVQSAVFYPPSLIVMAVAALAGGISLYALEWQAVLHFSLAGVFTFLFARHEFGRWEPLKRRLSLVALAAFLSAVVFTFGGYLTAYPSQQLAVLETNVWLPVILWCVSVAVGDGGRKTADGRNSAAVRRPPSAVLLAGASFGVALLAGHPQSALYLFVVTVAYAAFRGRQAGWRWREIAVCLGWLLAVALGVAAIQWLPSLEFMQASSRSTLTYADYARGFELQDPLQLLLPGSVSYYSPLYVGIVPLALMLLALWLPRRPQWVALFWLGLALFALALSFGGNLFLYPVLYLFAPGFALFRQQERAAFIFSFALAMLAGYGALALVAPLPQDARRRLRSFARLMGGVLLGAAIFFVLGYFAWSVAALQPDSPFRAASSRAAWLMLMLSVWAGLLWARRHGKLRGHLFIGALVLATALDLFTVNWHTNFQPAPPEAQERAPALLDSVLADGSLFRTYNEFRLYGNFGDAFRVADASGASPLRLARYDQFYKLPLERVWSLLGVKYVITWRKSLAELGVQSEVVATQQISESESTYVHRLEKVSPRAVVVSRVDVAATPDVVLSRLSAPDFDVTRQAVVEAPVGGLGIAGESGSAELVAQAPGHYIWQARAAQASLFVLAENFYPGWRAVVAGQEVPIVRANYVMMGVPVPAGTSQVELVFDPMSVKIGAVISALTLAGVAVGMVRRRRGGMTS